MTSYKNQTALLEDKLKNFCEIHEIAYKNSRKET